MTKRLKHIFNNPAHVAFHPLQKDGSGFVQTDARNAQGNWYFKTEDETRTVYSYRDDYPIASRFELGKKIVFLSRSGKPYSVTTAKHMSETDHAIPSTEKNVLVFRVAYVVRYTGFDTSEMAGHHYGHLYASHGKPDKATHHANLADYIVRIDVEIDEYTKARAFRKIQQAQARATDLVSEAKLYAKTFHLPAPKLPIIPKLTKERREKAQAYDAKVTARKFLEEAEDRRIWEEQKRIDALSREERVAAWRAGSTANLRQDFTTDNYALLRVRGTNVETSLGVTIPINGPTGAARLLLFLKTLKAFGRTYQSNGHSEHIGQFTVTSFDGEVLVAGCHRIKWAEIEAIAEQVLALATE